MRVLCVDDDPLSLAATARAVEKSGLARETLTAASAEAARPLIRQADLVITDLVMPGVTGMDLIDEIKRIDAEIEVIVVTGHGSIDTAVAAMQRGARDYLPKPVHPALVHQRLLTVLEVIESRREADDMRLARDVLERDLAEAIRRLENRVVALETTLCAIETVLSGDTAPADKLRAIATQVADFRDARTAGKDAVAP